MSATDYAVIDPATGETIKTYETISDDALTAAIGRASDAHPAWGRDTTVEERAKVIARVGELHNERQQELAEIIVREMGKPIEQAARRGRVHRGDLPVLRRQRRRRCSRTSRSTCSTATAPRSSAARRSGCCSGSCRGTTPTTRWPGSPARTWSSATRSCSSTRRSARSRRPRWSRSSTRPACPQDAYINIYATNDQIACVIARPARAGRVAHRLRPGGRRGGGDRRPAPQEGRARARRLGPVHRAQDRRPRRGGRGRGRRAPGEHGPGLQRRQALHRPGRALRRVRGEVRRGADRGRAGRPDVVGHGDRPAVVDRRGGPARGSRSSRRSTTAPGSSPAAAARATSSRRP